MAAAQRAAATNGPGPDLGPGPDPGSGSGPDPPRETMMGVSFLPTKNRSRNRLLISEKTNRRHESAEKTRRIQLE